MPPSLLRFYSRDTHNCFRERVTIFLEKPRETFLVLFKLEFQLLQEC